MRDKDYHLVGKIIFVSNSATDSATKFGKLAKIVIDVGNMAISYCSLDYAIAHRSRDEE